MKPFRLFVAVVLIAAGLATWWYFNPNQRPGFLGEALPVHPAAETRLYRWKGDDGHWVISDEPPTDGRDYEAIDYRQDTNVVPAFGEDD